MADSPPKQSDAGFEHTDVSSRGIVIAGAGVFAGLWITAGLLYFFYAALAQHREHVSPPVLPLEEHGYVVPPAPRLQRSPREEMKEMNEYEDWELSHYHWLDQKQGIVAIPIDKAIDMIASHGIPPATGTPNPTNTPPQEGTRETGFRGKVEPEAR
jgi:hypothetical protein